VLPDELFSVDDVTAKVAIEDLSDEFAVDDDQQRDDDDNE
jgi:hypothetical protein